jgi:D-xylose transport system substrate-binding protein
LKHSKIVKRASCISAAAITSAGLAAGMLGTADAATAPPTATSFTNTFAAMAALAPIAAQAKGKVAFLLPDTQSSVRWADFDAPYITRALKTAGLPASDIIVENAQGSDTTQLTQAEAAITAGAKVIALTSLDSTTGAAIEAKAKAAGVATIDYDRLNLGGSANVYVSFNNVKVGVLQGQGLVSCIAKWHVKKPQVFELDGSPTDNNATLFAQGYNSVLNPLYKAGRLKKVAEQAVPNWDNLKGLTIFQQSLTRHPNINSVLVANDGLDESVVSVLKIDKVPPFTVPTTGQDGTLQGMQNILQGYQCGSVYKPIYEEAEAASAAALYLDAGMSVPSSLINGATNNKVSNVPSILEVPEWVTAANMGATVVKDKFLTASSICSGFAKQCKTYHV